MRKTLERIYRKYRGIDLDISPEVNTSDLLSFVFLKCVQMIRGIFRGMPGTFLGSSVRIIGTSHLKIGENVAIGDRVYIFAISKNGVKIGSRSTIDRNASLLGSGVIRNVGVGIEIGENSAIGLSNTIHGGGGVRIGNSCLLGPHVALYSENHEFQDRGIPIREQGEVRSPIILEDDVWIGSHAVILAGVTIGRGSVVAAGSVVTSNVPEFSIVAGVPAKLVGNR